MESTPAVAGSVLVGAIAFWMSGLWRVTTAKERVPALSVTGQWSNSMDEKKPRGWGKFDALAKRIAAVPK